MRPSSARTREALFSIWMDRLPGARFLDLFAGSGAVGLEAVSRGCGAVTFIEAAARSLRSIDLNVRMLKGTDLAPASLRILRLPAVRGLGLLSREGARFDLLFADPPYRLVLGPLEGDALAEVAAGTASLAYEHAWSSSPPDLGELWLHTDLRRYGDSAVSFYEPARAPSATD